MSKARELADLMNKLKFEDKMQDELLSGWSKAQNVKPDSKEYLRVKMDLLEQRSKIQQQIFEIEREQENLKADILALREGKTKVLEQAKKAINKTTPSLDAIGSILLTFLKYNPNITVATVSTFFTIALYEGKRMTDYVDMTGLPKSTISRHLLELGPATVSYTKGMGLIEITSPRLWHPFSPDGQEYLPREEDRYLTKDKQDEREKLRANAKVFVLSRSGQELLGKIEQINDEAVNNFMRSVNQ